MAFIETKHLTKTYGTGDAKVVANDDISLSIEEHQLVVITGHSGAGKTTLLNLIGGLDHPTDGELWVDGENIAAFSSKERANYRRLQTGFVFQSYNLMPKLTAKENVELASDISDDPLAAETALDEVGLSERSDNLPAQLSGGEQQRVSIARSLAKQPKLLLADEPTGALDDDTGKTVLQLLQDFSHKKQATVILVTHNEAITPIADVVITLADGHVESIEENEQPAAVEDLTW